MKDMLSKQFSNAEENYMENQMVRESMQEELITLKKDSLNGNIEEKKYILSLHKIDATSFPEDDLEEKLTRWTRGIKGFYKIKQRKEMADPEEVFSDHKIIEVIRITSDKQYGLDFIEEIIVKKDNNKPYSLLRQASKCNPYSIVDEPSVGLIYLNIKEEKMVMILTKIQKFCDATLNKVLKEVKLNIFETEYKKKTSLLCE
ncbi:hypothetical protein Tco_0455194 [Tanacetum coccineum]